MQNNAIKTTNTKGLTNNIWDLTHNTKEVILNATELVHQTTGLTHTFKCMLSITSGPQQKYWDKVEVVCFET